MNSVIRMINIFLFSMLSDFLHEYWPNNASHQS
jgi:hypothetical protein